MNYICKKCGNPDSLEMLEEVRELVYECVDKDDDLEPGDCHKITFVCKGGCLTGDTE